MQEAEIASQSEKMICWGIQGTQKIHNKIFFRLRVGFSEYMGTGGEPNQEKTIAEKVFTRGNLFCNSKVELPYYSVDFFPKVCIHCGLQRDGRTLGNSTEVYPKCNINCASKAEVRRQKRKSVVSSDLNQKKKK